jgi:hypothetical protein
MGRPKKYRFNHQTAAKVRQLASLKMSVNTIADIIGIPPKSASRYYAKELGEGRALGQAAASNVIMNLIGANDFQAAKFYLETSPEWNKKNVTELSGPDGGPIEVEQNNSAVDMLAQLLGLDASEDEAE